ncbi:MAG TPA: hypothetical protein DC005_08435, partial [Proteobacteria bacterium]|nr:hypothetical protein [Pseudomonadota bacterium]
MGGGVVVEARLAKQRQQGRARGHPAAAMDRHAGGFVHHRQPPVTKEDRQVRHGGPLYGHARRRGGRAGGSPVRWGARGGAGGGAGATGTLPPLPLRPGALKSSAPPRHPEPSISTTIHGVTRGLKASEVRALEHLYRRRMARGEWISDEAARQLTEVAAALGRQVGLLIGRDGRVSHVLLGGADRLTIPPLGRERGASGRLCGLRLVHTHLGGEPLSPDDLTDLALLRLDLIAALTLTPDGLPDRAYLAYLDPEAEEATPARRLEPARFHDLVFDFAAVVEEVEAGLARRHRAVAVAGREGALLLGCFPPQAESEAAMAELAALCRACGLEPLDALVQHRRSPDARTVFGSGKLVEVITTALHCGATTLVFFQDLTPAQAKAITALSDLKVLDRTQVILDIFAHQAGTREAKLRVELAQLTYLKPR